VAIALVLLLISLQHFGPAVSSIRSSERGNCYINDSGFTCCNRLLENAMKLAINGSTDLSSSAYRIQKIAERVFGGKFEAVVSMQDFAHKNHFRDGNTCKVEKNGKYALAWQTT